MTMRAWCFADGVLNFSEHLPFGALPVSLCDDLDPKQVRRWRDDVEGFCRLAHDGVTRLIPGVPEAPDQIAAVDALAAFAIVLCKALRRKPRARRARAKSI